MSHVVYAQEWEETDRNHAERPDGFYLFLTKEDAEKGTMEQIKTMREAEHKVYQGAVPDEYNRPCGNPRPIEVSDETHAKLVASEHKCMYVRHLSEVEHQPPDKTIKTQSIYEKKLAVTPPPPKEKSVREMSRNELLELIKSAIEELSKR